MSIVKSTAATTKGNQPPWPTLVRFAAKKDVSTNRNSPDTGAKTHSGVRQVVRATTVINTVVIKNVPDTANP